MSDASPLTVVSTSTAPETFEPPTVIVFVVSVSVSVGRAPAATDDAVTGARVRWDPLRNTSWPATRHHCSSLRSLGRLGGCDLRRDQPRSANRLCRRPA